MFSVMQQALGLARPEQSHAEDEWQGQPTTVIVQCALST